MAFGEQGQTPWSVKRVSLAQQLLLSGLADSHSLQKGHACNQYLWELTIGSMWSSKERLWKNLQVEDAQLLRQERILRGRVADLIPRHLFPNLG